MECGSTEIDLTGYTAMISQRSDYWVVGFSVSKRINCFFVIRLFSHFKFEEMSLIFCLVV